MPIDVTELKALLLNMLAEDPDVRAAVRDLANLQTSDDDALEPDTRIPLATEPVRVQIIAATGPPALKPGDTISTAPGADLVAVAAQVRAAERGPRRGAPVPPWLAREGHGEPPGP